MRNFFLPAMRTRTFLGDGCDPEAGEGEVATGVGVVESFWELFDLFEYDMSGTVEARTSTVLEGCPATIEEDGDGAACSAMARLMAVLESEKIW